MIVDAHVHVYPPDFAAGRERLSRLDSYFGTLYGSLKAKMATAEDLLEAMDGAGVDLAVAAGFGWCDAGICADHNAYVLDCVKRYPDRLIGLATADPRDGAAAERELVRAIEGGLSGIGELMPDGPRYQIDEPRVADALGAIARSYDVPIMLHVSEPVGHLYPGKGTVSPAQVLRFAERHPDVRVVCAHWGGGLPFYELMPEVARALANVYYDTAAWPLLYDDRIFHAAAHMVPTKVLFATDFPLISQARALARVRALDLLPGLAAGFLGANAAHVYDRRPAR